MANQGDLSNYIHYQVYDEITYPCHNIILNISSSDKTGSREESNYLLKGNHPYY